MSRGLLLTGSEAKNAVADLLDAKPPILVEIRFPNSATSPDWRLCEDEEQFEQLFDRLAQGVELHINSVWDLTNLQGAIRLQK